MSVCLMQYFHATIYRIFPVVSLRQMERQMIRDKQRHADIKTSLEDHYKQQIANIESRLHTADTDRNLLMVNI